MYDVGVMGNGALAGLVAITSGTSTLYPWAAIIVGFIAGALYCLGSRASIFMKVLRPHSTADSPTPSEVLDGLTTHIAVLGLCYEPCACCGTTPPKCSCSASLRHWTELHSCGVPAAVPRVSTCGSFKSPARNITRLGSFAQRDDPRTPSPVHAWAPSLQA